MVQGIFDDRNTNTVLRWAYPDTGRWDAERNTREFLAAMPEWRRHGLLASTINLQGGMPVNGANSQPWHNSAFEADGALRADYLARLERILNEDDHYLFDQPENNFTAAIGEYASWGYYDQDTNNSADGYQSPPVNWGINTDRKQGFFRLVSEMSGEIGK